MADHKHPSDDILHMTPWIKLTNERLDSIEKRIDGFDQEIEAMRELIAEHGDLLRQSNS